MLLYIHGFNSSSRSFKARQLAASMVAFGRADEFVCPDLPHSPREAIALLDDLIDRERENGVFVVGSSLGGYYATHLAEKRALRAVLVNPAVRPYELLRAFVGYQTNLYSGERYAFTQQHLEQLEALEVDRITPNRYLVVLGTADEVLDYRRAVERYRGAEQIIIEGGDHSLTNFSAYVDRVLAFGGVDVSRR